MARNPWKLLLPAMAALWLALSAVCAAAEGEIVQLGVIVQNPADSSEETQLAPVALSCSAIQPLAEQAGTVGQPQKAEALSGVVPNKDEALLSQKYCFVIYMNHHRLLYESQVLEMGATLERPDFEPEWEGCIFAYWYDEDEYNEEEQDAPEPFEFPSVVMKDLTLMAYFVPGEMEMVVLDEGEGWEPVVPTVSIYALHDTPLKEGDIVMLWASISGFDGMNLRLQWQRSADNENWEDIPGWNSLSYNFVATPESMEYAVRLAVCATPGT